MSSFIETPGLVTTHEPSSTALANAHINSNRIVLLTSIAMPKADIFRNGLYQNIFVLYELIEALGYKPVIFTEKPIVDVSGATSLHDGMRTIDMNTFAAAPYYVYQVIEVAMGLAPQLRAQFKMLGARITKLYLGNVLNIDIEIPICIPPMNLSHHIAGELDAVWTSPHYAPNAEYAAIMNTGPDGRVPPGRTVPYVWDARFIQEENVKYMALQPAEQQRNFTIIEPNISFQKCALVPLMILEALYRRQPHCVGKVVVVNGDKLMQSPYFDLMVRPRLKLVQDGHVEFKPRMTIVDIMKTWPSNIVIANQILNEYNYIMIEHLTVGFPYVHNCASLADYGYYYEGCDIEKGVNAVLRAIETHDFREGATRAEADQLAWKFSPHNPETLKVWGELLGGS